MNTNESVYSVGLTDCDLNEANTTRTWLTDSRHREAVLDVTFHRLKELLWSETNLVPTRHVARNFDGRGQTTTKSQHLNI